MKLLYCRYCGSVFNLSKVMKSCKCKRTKGKYLDDLNAVYSGEWATPLGIDNSSFHEALIKSPIEEPSVKFNSFIIPERCITFWRIE